MIADRIRQARLAAGMTQDEVVQRLASAGHPITKAALSKYEKRKSEPKQTLLILLGRALGVKPSYFFSEPTLTTNWLAFRKQTKLSKSKQEQIKAYAEKVVEHQAWLQATLYPRQKPFFPKPMEVRSPEDAEAASRRLRGAWELGDAPIDSLVETVEDKGGFVVEYVESGIQFDGLSGKADGRPVIVVNPGTQMDRCRYNVAHELGHIFTACPPRLSEKERESIAHRFAAALLVPEKVAKEELGEKRRHLDFVELGVLKQKYGLSMQAWIRRAKDLEIISGSVYRSLCIEFSKRGCRQREPDRYDYHGREKPKRLMQMVRRAVSEGIVSLDDANRMCPESGADSIAVVHKMGESTLSPTELLRLPRCERTAILATAALQAEKEYRTNSDLTDFDAFGEDDLHVEDSSTKKR
ncbi:MAG: helix-turn-helix domain-containing protein [Pirellulales bacterium]|nr:helix-turn-helix domain-containing protein [Pirellulales bacterium]